MIGQHSLLGRCGGLVILLGGLWGCNTSPPTNPESAPPVTVRQPQLREVIDHDDYEGRIAAVETVEVRARVRGHLDKVYFQDGKLVKEGDPLFEIDPRPYKAALDAAEAQKAAAEASLELARKEYARYSQLLRSGASTREEVEVWSAKQAVAQAERLKALAAVEQAQLDLGFTKVTAKIAGKISRAQVTRGNLVNASGGETLLTTITTVDPTYVYFDVDERSLLRYRKDYARDRSKAEIEVPIKELKIPVEVALDGEKGFPHKGLLDFTDNQVKASTGTIQVRGTLPNPKGIIDSGMRARVQIPVSDPHKVMLISEQAIGSEQGTSSFTSSTIRTSWNGATSSWTG